MHSEVYTSTTPHTTTQTLLIGSVHMYIELLEAAKNKSRRKKMRVNHLQLLQSINQ